MQREFQKVNTEQIFLMWRNVAVSMLSLVLLHVLTTLLPAIFAPVVSTVIAIFLYYQVVSCSYSRNETCGIVPYIFFLVVTSYTVILVSLNVFHVWGVIDLPGEMVFFDKPYLQSLLLAPTGFVTTLIAYLHRRKLTLCVNCKLTNGSPLDRGRVGVIYSNESAFQMLNIMSLYAILSIVIYVYYLLEFVDVTINPRDRFIFSGVAIFFYLIDIVYFGMRYYNLYLDLKERDELLSPYDINTLGTRTYVRFYVIAGDSLYMSSTTLDGLRDDESDIIDTPFLIKRTVNGIQEYEIQRFIETQTGVRDGELRFFYGRAVADAAGRKVLRYFYFLPGEPEDYPKLEVDGEWISSDKLKTIYNNAPDRLSNVCLSDISRIALVTITSKTYDDNGERRTRLTHYRPSFSLRELRYDNLDFQDDKWIRISMFNSDTSFYRFKRWWRHHIRRTYYE